MSELELIVEGMRYGGWKKVAVHRSIEHIAGAFEIEVSEKWPGNPVAREILPGQSCKVELDGETVITGYVDLVDIGYSNRDHTVAIQGRDKTGDLVDCSHHFSPGSWQKVKADLLIRKFCEPYGIKTIFEAPVGKPIRTLSHIGGERTFDLISRVCEQRALLPVSDGLGNLVITRAGTKRAAGALVFGENIISAQVTNSHADRFSDYLFVGQNDYLPGWKVTASTEPYGHAIDPGIKRYRPDTRISEGPGDSADFADRARWRATIAAGRSRRAVYTVQGWRDAAGNLWAPNSMITVNDPVAGIDLPLLIVDVENVKSGDGSLTNLTVTRREAYELIEIEPDDPMEFWSAPQ